MNETLKARPRFRSWADDTTQDGTGGFGRVPFFYYVLHLPAIHLAAVLFSLAKYGNVQEWLFQNHPVMSGPPPEGWGVGLMGVYAVTFAVVFVLYWPCAWMARWKDRTRSAWASFV